MPVREDMFSCLTPEVAPSKCDEAVIHAPFRCETDERKVGVVRGSDCSHFEVSGSGPGNNG